MPPPIGPSSSTTTDLPSRASRYAVVNPAMPAPITQTFVLVSLSKAVSDGTSVVAIQTEVVVPEVGRIQFSACDLFRLEASHMPVRLHEPGVESALSTLL